MTDNGMDDFRIDGGLATVPITDSDVTSYISSLTRERSAVLRRLEKEAQEEAIPIIQLAGASLLRLLCALHRPRRILEIGTAIGYSAIHLAEAAREARIVTIEIDEARAARAEVNFREASVAERIELIRGDALDHLPGLRESFDMIFIDAAKGKNAQFLGEACRLCRSGGLIVTDNVLFRGLAAQPPDEVERRHRSTVRRIREYNELLRCHPELDTTFLAVGDGMAISIKR